MKRFARWGVCLLPLSLAMTTIAHAQQPSQQPAAAPAQPYPPEVVITQTQSCVASLQKQNPTTPAQLINGYCQCNVEQMQRTVSLTDLNALGSAISSRRPLDDNQQRVVAILNQNVDICAKQQGLKPKK
jgi:hypothetical protein